jgi:hypothetical protein
MHYTFPQVVFACCSGLENQALSNQYMTEVAVQEKK